jgi:uncharacterized protein (TIGR01777 family)
MPKQEETRMNALITGSSGLVGSALVESLFKKKYAIQCLSRNKDKGDSQFWEFDNPEKITTKPYQAVIHLAGENVATGRWTESKKRNILKSRIDGTRRLVDHLIGMKQKPDVFLCASAVGYYGSRGNEILSEESSLGSGFLAEVCREWEKETERLSTHGVRVVNLRFGMVLSPNGGALQKMIPPFKMRLGGIVGNGKQYISWISIRDVVEIVDFIIKNDTISGPVNIVTPNPTTNRELTKALGHSLNCATIFKVPGVVVKTIFGQMADEMLLCSAQAQPQKLLEAGYQYKDLSLSTTLDYCINGE